MLSKNRHFEARCGPSEGSGDDKGYATALASSATDVEISPNLFYAVLQAAQAAGLGHAIVTGGEGLSLNPAPIIFNRGSHLLLVHIDHDLDLRGLGMVADIRQDVLDGAKDEHLHVGGEAAFTPRNHQAQIEAGFLLEHIRIPADCGY